MDPFKYQIVASGAQRILSPVSIARIDRVIDLMELPDDPQVLDLCCGKGEVLTRIIERWGGAGLGVDHCEEFLKAARSNASVRVPDAEVTFTEMDAWELEVEPETYDLIVVMNARPFGDFRETLRKCWAMVRSGGRVLVGEHFWTGEPNLDLVDFLGCGPNAYESHADNVRLAVKESFTPLYFTASSQDELDDFAAKQWWSVERFLRESPGDSHANAFRERIRRTRDAYLDWSRDSLGFALYLLRK